MKKMKKNSLQVGVIQQACTGDREQNLAATVKAIEQAAAKGVQLILLQELHTNLYFCQTENVNLFDLAEPIPGPTTTFLSKIARQFDMVIVGSIFEKRAVGLYHNTAVVIEKNGDLVGRYRKMHIPDDPGYYEKYYFTPGDGGFLPINTSVGKLGVMVCWDQWFPEGARLMALRGADLLLYPTAIGWLSQELDEAEKKRQREAWMLIQRSHAIANGLSVLVANRTGFERAMSDGDLGLHFWGSSFIAGPQGEILAEASIDRAELLLAEIDLHRHERVRRAWPYLRDRRIDAYQDLVARYLT
jgi:N-carbamoylputrescine amidase